MASNLSQSYEKVVLVLGILVAGGLGTFAYLQAGKLEAQFERQKGRPQPAPELPGQGPIGIAITNIEAPPGAHQVKRGVVNGERKVDLYTGIPWFMKREGAQTVDLGDKDEPDVHKGIPNSWWLENHLDPGYADSPNRDADGDGFSNKEEFLADTDPNSEKSYGDLATKIVLFKLVKEPYRLELASEAGSTYKMKYEDAFTGKRRTNSSPYIPAGDTAQSIFFADTPAQTKFKLLQVERKKIRQESTGIEMEESFATVEILTGGKKGQQRVVPRRDKKFIVRDYKVILTLNAIGEELNEFEVEENGSFSLPYDPDAADKPFTFKGVDEKENVIIEGPRGGKIETFILKP